MLPDTCRAGPTRRLIRAPMTAVATGQAVLTQRKETSMYSRMRRLGLAVAVLGLFTASMASTARADLISNGSFEGGFAGWTVADEPGGSGSWFIQTGTGSPMNGFPVPPP